MLWTTDHHSAKHVKECLGGQGWGLVLLKYREDLTAWMMRKLGQFIASFASSQRLVAHKMKSEIFRISQNLKLLA